MKLIRVLFVFVIFILIQTMPALAAEYDIVINNGRVMDPETNFDAVRNVGIKEGKIAVITEKKIKGKETNDDHGP